MPSTNVILIGPPGSGKSTIGVLLAKRLTLGFVDTDLHIQTRTGESLQQTVDRDGYLRLREIERDVLLELDVDHHVVATGGSVVYSDDAMRHLRELGTTVFLDIDEPTMRRRIGDAGTRGLAKAADQTIGQMHAERRPLYLQYADHIVSGDGSPETVVRQVASSVMKSDRIDRNS